MNYYILYAYVVVFTYVSKAEAQCNFNLLTMQYIVLHNSECACFKFNEYIIQTVPNGFEL